MEAVFARGARAGRWVAAGAVASLLAVACGGEDSSPASAVRPSSPTTVDSPETVPVEQIAESPLEDVPSALDAARGGEVGGLPPPSVSLLELRSGGPPPDGIPPIDRPVFLRAGEVGFLTDSEPVLALEIAGEARAYPVQILIWHEIVNDTVGGLPVAVTYCPLCNSALAYDRRVDGRVLSFGTSGLLWNSSLVMYDRQTESLWSHFTGDAIAGVLTDVELSTFPVATVPWGAWRDAHPGGLVLSSDTGFDREYGTNPYPGYDDVSVTPFLFEGEVDGRYTAMTRVVGIEHGRAAAAVPLVVLREERVVSVSLDGSDLVIWWQPGTVSALDEADISSGADVGATGVFRPEVDGQVLTFRPLGAGFVDDETGSEWNLLGQATGGPLKGERLDAVAHVDTFWFAWTVFRPDTEVID